MPALSQPEESPSEYHLHDAADAADHSYLLQLLRSFLGTPSQTAESDAEYIENAEKSGCALWDVSADADRALAMVEKNVLDVIEVVLMQQFAQEWGTQDYEETSDSINLRSRQGRRIELCLGILGNLLSHEAVAQKLPASLLALLSSPFIVELDDPAALSELFRAISMGMRHEACARTWLQLLCSSPDVLSHIVFVASNTLDALCLERCMDAMVALLHAEQQYAQQTQTPQEAPLPSCSAAAAGTAADHDTAVQDLHHAGSASGPEAHAEQGLGEDPVGKQIAMAHGNSSEEQQQQQCHSHSQEQEQLCQQQQQLTVLLLEAGVLQVVEEVLAAACRQRSRSSGTMWGQQQQQQGADNGDGDVWGPDDTTESYADAPEGTGPQVSDEALDSALRLMEELLACREGSRALHEALGQQQQQLPAVGGASRTEGLAHWLLQLLHITDSAQVLVGLLLVLVEVSAHVAPLMGLGLDSSLPRLAEVVVEVQEEHQQQVLQAVWYLAARAVQAAAATATTGTAAAATRHHGSTRIIQEPQAAEGTAAAAAAGGQGVSTAGETRPTADVMAAGLAADKAAASGSSRRLQQACQHLLRLPVPASCLPAACALCRALAAALVADGVRQDELLQAALVLGLHTPLGAEGGGSTVGQVGQVRVQACLTHLLQV